MTLHNPNVSEEAISTQNSGFEEETTDDKEPIVPAIHFWHEGLSHRALSEWINPSVPRNSRNEICETHDSELFWQPDCLGISA
jgi:hypothetical protein